MLGAFLLLGFGSASAQTTNCDSTVPFIALNLADRDGDTANKSVAFPKAKDLDPEGLLAADSLRKELDAYADTPQDASRDDALFGSFSSALTKGNTRWITQKGDRIAIYVIYDTSKEKTPVLKVTEKARKTRLATDLETFAKLVQKIGRFKLESVQLNTSNFAVLKQCRILTKVRADLEVTATAELKKVEDQATQNQGSGSGDKSQRNEIQGETPPPGSSGTNPTSSGNAGDNSTPATTEATITVTTGPIEHAFLSADLAVNNVKELKIESGELVNKDNPSTFYVGFDYMVGDVLAETNTLAQSLTFKALVQASRKPLDSLGIALGMRLKLINAPFGFQLDTLSPWVGYIWNRNDTMTGTKTGHEYKGDWRVGISLNLDKALGWVQ
jgi:Asp-tRNA(Asn)/Glu-tRNA(Gln) amidotransferase C subunit